MIKEGDKIFHVTPSGKIYKATAMTNEKKNAVSIVYEHNGLSSEVGTWHLFNTEVGAKRAAAVLRSNDD